MIDGAGSKGLGERLQFVAASDVALLTDDRICTSPSMVLSVGGGTLREPASHPGMPRH